MKKRWADTYGECECGNEIMIGDICYICKCCDRMLCKKCGNIHPEKILKIVDVCEDVPPEWYGLPKE